MAFDITKIVAKQTPINDEVAVWLDIINKYGSVSDRKDLELIGDVKYGAFWKRFLTNIKEYPSDASNMNLVFLECVRKILNSVMQSSGITVDDCFSKWEVEVHNGGKFYVYDEVVKSMEQFERLMGEQALLRMLASRDKRRPF